MRWSRIVPIVSGVLFGIIKLYVESTGDVAGGYATVSQRDAMSMDFYDLSGEWVNSVSLFVQDKSAKRAKSHCSSLGYCRSITLTDIADSSGSHHVHDRVSVEQKDGTDHLDVWLNYASRSEVKSVFVSGPEEPADALILISSRPSHYMTISAPADGEKTYQLTSDRSLMATLDIFGKNKLRSATYTSEADCTSLDMEAVVASLGTSLRGDWRGGWSFLYPLDWLSFASVSASAVHVGCVHHVIELKLSAKTPLNLTSHWGATNRCAFEWDQQCVVLPTGSEGAVTPNPKYSSRFNAAKAELFRARSHFSGEFSIERQQGVKESKRIESFSATVPSRQSFPRPFLWDEGFHLLGQLYSGLVTQEEVLSSIFGWFDMVQDGGSGWIPRELVLSSQAGSLESKFVVQKPTVLNPPTLLFTIRALFLQNTASPETLGIVRTLFEKLESWFDHFQKVALFDAPGCDGTGFERGNCCYRWPDKTAGHILSSGLDDYPRGVLTNQRKGFSILKARRIQVERHRECHLDLHSWMTFFAKTLHQLCAKYDDPYTCSARNWEAIYRLHLTGLESVHYVGDAPEQVTIHNRVEVHETSMVFADYLGTQPITLKGRERATFDIGFTTDGRCDIQKGIFCDPESSTPCCSQSGWCGASDAHCSCKTCKPVDAWDIISGLDKNKWKVDNVFSPHFGYVNLMPVMLGLLQPNDPRIDRLVSSIKWHKLLSPAGLLSLSPDDDMYGKGENYWRSGIWAPMNLLAAGAFKAYGHESLAESIRSGWSDSMWAEWSSESSNGKGPCEYLRADDGKCGGVRPFGGWTSVGMALFSMDDWDVFWRESIASQPRFNFGG